MKNKKAFSLMELLVVMGLMAIMTGILFAGRNNNTAGKDVDAAAQQIVAQLRALQTDALNGKIVNGRSVNYFYFNTSATANTYNISYRDKDNVEISAFSNRLKPAVNVIDSNLSFASPWATVSPAATTTITVSSAKAGSTAAMRICVYPSGNIKTTTSATCPNENVN